MSDGTPTTSTSTPAPAAPSALEAAVAAFTEAFRHEDAIGEVAAALECNEALALAGLFRAAGEPYAAEQWLITHHEFDDDCDCLEEARRRGW